MLEWYQQTCDIVPRDYGRRFTDRIMWAMIKPDCPPHLEEAARKMISDGAGIAHIKSQLEVMKADEME